MRVKIAARTVHCAIPPLLLLSLTLLLTTCHAAVPLEIVSNSLAIEQGVVSDFAVQAAQNDVLVTASEIDADVTNFEQLYTMAARTWKVSIYLVRLHPDLQGMSVTRVFHDTRALNPDWPGTELGNAADVVVVEDSSTHVATVALGDWSAHADTGRSGAVLILDATDSSRSAWNRSAVVLAPAATERFGYDVSLSQLSSGVTVLVVSAGGVYNQPGAVFSFTRTPGQLSWTRAGDLALGSVPPNPDVYGFAVASHEDTSTGTLYAAVGAPGARTVHFFSSSDDASSFSLIDSITDSSGCVGNALEMHFPLLVAGDRCDSRAVMFEFSGQWNATTTLVPDGLAVGNRLGKAVSMADSSGSRVVLGGDLAYAAVFERSGPATWTDVQHYRSQNGDGTGTRMARGVALTPEFVSFGNTGTYDPSLFVLSNYSRVGCAECIRAMASNGVMGQADELPPLWSEMLVGLDISEHETAEISRLARLSGSGQRVILSAYSVTATAYICRFNGALFEVERSLQSSSSTRLYVGTLLPDETKSIDAPQSLIAINHIGDVTAHGCPRCASSVGEVYVFRNSTEISVSVPPGDSGFGTSVALDASGDILAASSVMAGTDSRVYIFTFDGGSSYVQQASLAPAPLLSDSGFGSSLSFSSSGTTLAIGASLQDAVFVFSGSGASWTQQKQLTPSANTTRLGHIVSCNVDCSVIAAGAPRTQVSAVSDAGAAVVFTATSASDLAGGWTDTRLLHPEGGLRFGQDLQLNGAGDHLIVGAHNRAFRFSLRASGWTAARIRTSVEQIMYGAAAWSSYTDPRFGSSVSIDSSGARMLVGVPEGVDMAGERSAAFVYENPMDLHMWSIDSASVGLDESSYFGHSVAMHGHKILVGAPYASSDYLADGGAAYVFRQSTDARSFEYEAVLQPDAPSGLVFGHQVDMYGDVALVCASSDGDILIHREKYDGTTPSSGSRLSPGDGLGYVFNYDGDNAWNQQQVLSTVGGNTGFCFSGVVGDGIIAIGSWSNSPVFAGSVLVFTYNESLQLWELMQTVANPVQSRSLEGGGFCVGMSEYGHTLTMGLPDWGGLAGSGAGFSFNNATGQYVSADTGQASGQIRDLVGNVNHDAFGMTCDASTSFALCGTGFVGDFARAGSACLWRRSSLEPDATWTQTQCLRGNERTRASTTAWVRFGWDTGLEDRHLVVSTYGAGGDRVPGPSTMAADYLYIRPSNDTDLFSVRYPLMPSTRIDSIGVDLATSAGSSAQSAVFGSARVSVDEFLSDTSRVHVLTGNCPAGTRFDISHWPDVCRRCEGRLTSLASGSLWCGAVGVDCELTQQPRLVGAVSDTQLSSVFGGDVITLQFEALFNASTANDVLSMVEYVQTSAFVQIGGFNNDDEFVADPLASCTPTSTNITAVTNLTNPLLYVAGNRNGSLALLFNASCRVGPGAGSGWRAAVAITSLPCAVGNPEFAYPEPTVDFSGVQVVSGKAITSGRQLTLASPEPVEIFIPGSNLGTSPGAVEVVYSLDFAVNAQSLLKRWSGGSGSAMAKSHLQSFEFNCAVLHVDSTGLRCRTEGDEINKMQASVDASLKLTMRVRVGRAFVVVPENEELLVRPLYDIPFITHVTGCPAGDLSTNGTFSCPRQGSLIVTVRGINLTPATDILIGSTLCFNPSFTDDEEIVCTLPEGYGAVPISAVGYKNEALFYGPPERLLAYEPLVVLKLRCGDNEVTCGSSNTTCSITCPRSFPTLSVVGEDLRRGVSAITVNGAECLELGGSADDANTVTCTLPSGFQAGLPVLVRDLGGQAQSNQVLLGYELCPTGFKATATNTSLGIDYQCEQCPAGTFVLPQQTVCSSCDAGKFSNASSSSCTACSAGKFSELPRSSRCLPCVNGSYTELRQQSACLRCVPGRFTPDVPELERETHEGFAHCAACDAGWFAPHAGLNQCTQCAAGRYAQHVGRDECTACERGKFSGSPGASACDACPFGSVAPRPNSTACSECPIGTQALQAEVDCVQCPIGRAGTARGECTICPPGRFTEKPGQLECLHCSPGSFQNASEQNTCVDCAPGSVSASNGSTVCSPCSAGYFAERAGSTVCRACSAGRFTSFDGGQQCNRCSPGTFASGVANSACLACQVGTFAGEGATNCTACAEGTIAAQNGSSTCTPCAPGSFAEVRGASSCTSCPRGRFAASEEALQCEPCANGSFAAFVGSPACTLCAPGKFALEQGAQRCASCSAGTFASDDGSSRCTVCPAGKYTSRNGSVVCSDCQPGTFHRNEGGSSCTRCREGTFSGSPGATTCELCKRNEFANSTSGALSCSTCPPGFVSERGASACSPCEPGTARLTQDFCEPCERGKSQQLSGQAVCPVCTEGSFADTGGSTSCSPCPMNTVAPGQGSTACTQCAPSEWTAGVGSSVCSSCADEQYVVWEASTSGMDRRHESCEPCPRGVDCRRGEVHAENDVWVAFSTDSQLVRFVCAPGRCTRCAEGSNSQSCCTSNRLNASENPMCARCEQDYVEQGGACVECDETNLMMVGVMFGSMFVFVVFLHAVLNQDSNSLVPVLFYFSQTVLVLIGEAPEVLRWMSLFDLSPVALFASNSASTCTVKWTPVEREAIGLLLPVLSYVFLLVIFVPHVALHWAQSKAAGRYPHYRKLATPYARSCIAFLFMTYNTIAQSSIQYFSRINVNGHCVLATAPDVWCDDRDSQYAAYTPLFVFGLFFTVMVPLGVLVMLRSQLIRSAADVHDKARSGEVVDEYRKFKGPVRIFGGLFATLRGDSSSLSYHWRFVVLLRRCALIAANVVLITQGKEHRQRYFVLTLLNSVFFLLHVVVNPYRVMSLEGTFGATDGTLHHEALQLGSLHDVNPGKLAELRKHWTAKRLDVNRLEMLSLFLLVALSAFLGSVEFPLEHGEQVVVATVVCSWMLVLHVLVALRLFAKQAWKHLRPVSLRKHSKFAGRILPRRASQTSGRLGSGEDDDEEDEDDYGYDEEEQDEDPENTMYHGNGVASSSQDALPQHVGVELQPLPRARSVQSEPGEPDYDAAIHANAYATPPQQAARLKDVGSMYAVLDHGGSSAAVEDETARMPTMAVTQTGGADEVAYSFQEEEHDDDDYDDDDAALQESSMQPFEGTPSSAQRA